MKVKEPLPDQIKYDSRLVMNNLGNSFTRLPQSLEVMNNSQAPSFSREEQDIVSGMITLDPDVRVFKTSYSSSGLITEWGKSDMSKIQRLCYWYDDLQRRWSQTEVGVKKRYRMKRQGEEFISRLENWWMGIGRLYF